jgi:hypothetical protein
MAVRSAFSKDQPMTSLMGQAGELSITVQITRKATGLTENVELVGYVDADQLKQLQDAGQLPATPKDQE